MACTCLNLERVPLPPPPSRIRISDLKIQQRTFPTLKFVKRGAVCGEANQAKPFVFFHPSRRVDLLATWGNVPAQYQQSGPPPTGAGHKSEYYGTVSRPNETVSPIERSTVIPAIIKPKPQPVVLTTQLNHT